MGSGHRKFSVVADTVQTVWHRYRERDLQFWRFALRVCTWIFEFAFFPDLHDVVSTDFRQFEQYLNVSGIDVRYFLVTASYL